MDEIKYRFSVSGSREDYLALNRLFIQKSRLWRVVIPLLRTVEFLLGAFCVLTGVLMLLPVAAREDRSWSLALGLLIPGLFLLYRSLFYYRRRARRTGRSAVQDAGEATLTFSDESITETTSKGGATYPYSAFVEAYAYDARWFLFLDERHAFILPRAAMTEGEKETFSAFLSEKLGKPVVTLRARGEKRKGERQ